MNGSTQLERVRSFLLELQESICSSLEEVDGQARFSMDRLEGERGGLAIPRVLSDGPVLERAAVNFSHTSGQKLPTAATTQRPQLAGGSFSAASMSLIMHPRNPYAPTSHANFRYFEASTDETSAWWFGGGYDLTPYYGFEEDARHWHRTAKAACDQLDADAYARFKKACDEYFFLPHRNEARGIGGIFYDDLDQPDFESCFDFVQAAGRSYVPAYRPILEKRKDHEYGDRERQHQLLRRGRYVEFNLLYDRGTKYGLQASGRTESILASLPPVVNWQYRAEAAPGTPEADLLRFLEPRDWL